MEPTTHARGALPDTRAAASMETEAHVTQIRFDGDRAVGVTYEQAGTQVDADASAEVLVCGGAINSPQLLMLSGIGPAEHLREQLEEHKQYLNHLREQVDDESEEDVVYLEDLDSESDETFQIG